MLSPAKRRFWRRARLIFRCFRITVWLVVLAVLCFLIWLNTVGLPDFLKNRLQSELRAQGLEVGFTRMRLRWHHGIVAEQVRVEPTREGAGPVLTAGELVLRLDYQALARRQLKLHGVALTDGRMTVPLRDGAQPARDLLVERMHAQVDFLSEARWQLSAFQGRCLDLDFQLTGCVSNAPALLERPPADDATTRQRAAFWSRLVTQLEQVRFTPPARLKGSFSTDARNPSALAARVELAADRLESPWGGGRQCAAFFSMLPHSNRVSLLEFKLSVRRARAPWGEFRPLTLAASAELPMEQSQIINARADFDADLVQTRWGRGRRLHGELAVASLSAPGQGGSSSLHIHLASPRNAWAEAAELDGKAWLDPSPTNKAWALGRIECRTTKLHTASLDATQAVVTLHSTLPLTNYWPHSVSASLELDKPRLRPIPAANQATAPSSPPPSALAGGARQLRLEATLDLPPAAELALSQTNLPWRSRLDRIPAVGHVEIEDLQAGQVALERLVFDTRWRAPVCHFEGLRADLYGGQLTATARVDVVSRELTGGLAAEVDIQRLPGVKPEAAPTTRWPIAWEKLPHLQAGWHTILPAWTHLTTTPAHDWLTALELAGTFESGAGTAGSVPFLSVRSAFGLTNMLGTVPRLEIARPEGGLALNLEGDLRQQSFRAGLSSSIDLKALGPLFGEGKEAVQALGLFEFTQPPNLELELAGRWNHWEETVLRGRVALTNMTFRQQAIKNCTAGLAYSNQVVDILHGRVEREEGWGTVEQVRVDLRREVLGITNVQSAVDPLAVAHAIGPHVERILSPYRFSRPPQVHFEGTVGLRQGSGYDDARFEVTGGPFQWQSFRLSQISARLHWLRDALTLTDFKGTMHDGQVQGDAFFDLSRPDSSVDFQFHLTATNVNARPLMTDLFPKYTNQLEGLLGGRLIITNANSDDWAHWFGYGDASLREGMIWNVPVFRLVSPILNKVAPGLGNSRAKEATASFLITNSVIATRDLEVRATGMRMQFDGTVDFEGAVHGTLEAELFRGLPAFGWMLSRVLWPVTKIFEYKLSGTLSNPKTEPLFLPKILFAPLHPLRTLKELWQEDSNAP